MGTVAVIGAGNGGFAMAGDLSLAGLNVNLFEFSEFEGNIELLRKLKAIKITGAARTGTAKINVVTSDLAEALDGAEVIMITTRAGSHERVGRELAPLLKEGQSVFFLPGSMGSLFLYNELKSLAGKRVMLAETITLPYAARKTGPDSVKVHRRTGNLGISAFPAKDTAKMFGIFNTYYPASHTMKNILEVALCNTNIIAHPIPILMGASAIERANGTFNFYGEGHSPCVDRAIVSLDKEIGTLLRAFECNVTSPIKAVEYRFSMTSQEIQEMRAKWNILVNIDNDMRFISEDVQECLVFIVTLGRQFNIPTPITESLVCLLSLFVEGADYYATGRTMEKLGLADLDKKGLLELLQSGVN